jgi:4'-phosphopantetheinyl transferase
VTVDPVERRIFAPAAAAGGPAAGCAEVWIADLDAIDADPALADEEERRRAAKLATPVLQRRFLATRTVLRRLLAGYLGTAPGALRFAYGPHGKPRLAVDGGLHFNLSHAQGLAAFAFTRAGDIGVDVEVIRPLAHLDGMARRCLTPAELRGWWGLAVEDRVAAFFRAWTRKEAVLKALGAGVSGGLANVEVGFAAGGPLQVTGRGGPVSGHDAWSLWEIAVPAGAVGAVAIATADVAVDHR